MNKIDEGKCLRDMTCREIKHIILEIIEELEIKSSIIEQEKTNPPLINQLIPRQQVADEFKVTALTIDQWVKRGLFPTPFKQGGRTYFLHSDLIQHIQKKGGQHG